MSRFFKSAAFPILIVVIIAFFAAKLIVPSSQKGPAHSYQTLVTEDIPNHQVASANIKTKDNSVSITLKNKEKYEVGFVDQSEPQLTEELRKSGAKFNVESNKTSIWPSLLTFLLPLVLILGFWFFLINQVQGGGSRVMSFGKSRAKRLSADSPKITFREDRKSVV